MICTLLTLEAIITRLFLIKKIPISVIDMGIFVTRKLPARPVVPESL